MAGFPFSWPTIPGTKRVGFFYVGSETLRNALGLITSVMTRL